MENRSAEKMENRSAEIAHKKAQKQTGQSRTGKSQQADWKSQDNNPAFFVRADAVGPPNFPNDIKLERGGLGIDPNSALIIPVPLRAVTPDVLILKPARKATKPAVKRKAKAKKTTTPPIACTKVSSRVTKSKINAAAAKKPATRKPRAAVSEKTAPPAVPQTVFLSPLVQPDAPLPRARAVTVYRKNGIVDILGYWMRSRVSDLLKLFSPRPKLARPAPKMADLIAENAALRQEIARLRALT